METLGETMNLVLKLIAENLKRLRKERRLTQEQLAERVGVMTQTISNIENSKSYPEFATLCGIIHALEIRPCDIFKEPGVDDFMTEEKFLSKISEFFPNTAVRTNMAERKTYIISHARG